MTKENKVKKGDQGDTPQIGLVQQEDGNWYWTLNGNLMTDAGGQPIRANGEKGEQGDKGEQGTPGETGDTGATGPAGTPAPAPQIAIGSSLGGGTVATDEGRVDETAWYLSVDGGLTWYRISGDQESRAIKGDTGDTGSHRGARRCLVCQKPRTVGRWHVLPLHVGR